MKNKLKTYSLLHLAVLYCFILGIYSTTILSDDLGSLSGSSRFGENYYSIASSNISFPLTKSENTVYGADISFPSSVKNTLHEFSFCSKEAEIVLFNSVIKHINFFKIFVLPFQSTDIIFPFHYFW
jgi:hypothetical protein